MFERLSLEGKRFGKLLVIKMTGMEKTNTMWECLCDCGQKKVIRGCYLTRVNGTKSCGCLARTHPNHKTHGYYRHAVYKLYQMIRNRCYNKNDPCYLKYGALGIRMCDEWYENRESFIEWALKNGWEKGLQIDKDIKSKKLGISPAIYSPKTCQFVTRVENMNARGNSRRYIYKNEEYTLRALSERFNIKRSTLAMRIYKYGYSVEQAIEKSLK